jgi:glucose/arabinose dehydrogenase
MRLAALAVSASVAALGVAFAAPAAAEKIQLETFAEGLTAPLAMVQPPGDDRFFVIEQHGTVRVIEDGQLRDEPFLNIRHRVSNQISDFDERGLLGLAFHPDFANNGLFYIAYSTRLMGGDTDLAKKLWWSHTNLVVERRVHPDDPDIADPLYERIITAIDWPQFNHNGHWIGFGPDGYLYIATGDGGYANDWGIGHNPAIGNGQDLTNILGKILRIDVNVEPGSAEPYAIPADNPFANNQEALPEIYAYGLRNPWRCSFDMGGDNELFCADVQQNSFEEVNIIEAGGNFGWRVMEASHCFDYLAPDDHPATCDNEGMIMPILEYENCTARPQNCMGISVTGGYVYRGAHEPWQGKYIFGDWSKSFAERDGQIFLGTKGDDGNWTMELADVVGQEGPLPYILAFAQDNDGEVYALTSVTTGPVGGLDRIYKIVPAN